MVLGVFSFIFWPEVFGVKSLFGDVAPLDVWHTLRDAGAAGPAAFFLWMACATAVKLLGISAGVIRWRLLLKGQGLHIPLPYLVYQWFMGRTIGLVLPGTLGLDGYRLVESSRYTKEPVKCAAVIAVEKLTGIIALSCLVFMTFPLGFKYLQINIVLLAVIMTFLLAGVVTSLLLLLNPRVIQVLAAIVPVPPFARGLINNLGRAATAYSGRKLNLLLALFFGLLVHLGTCSMYFFTFMAIRAANVSIADIFFVSPLMITASVFAFTISGLGVREVAFGLVLGSSTGHAVAILGGHLGLWAGEIVPFVLSIPLLLFGGRPNRAALKEDRAKISEELDRAGMPLSALLPVEEVRRYRREVFGLLGCGMVVGGIVGAQIAVAESLWILKQLPGLHTWGMFPWGVIVYGLIFGGVGIGIAGALLFLSLLIDRFLPWSANAAFVYAGTFAIGTMVIGMFRYQRDILAGHSMTGREYAILLVFTCGIALILGVLVFVKAEFMRKHMRFTVPRFALLCAAGWLTIFGMSTAVATWGAPGKPMVHYAPKVKGTGSNIVLCAIDALRADYLRLYSPDAQADTPNLDAFAQDSILFYNAFSQASWTKPSFGTIFTGVYPTTHGAVTKTASLSPDIETLSELLQQGGYFTKGFSNNPNMTRIFGMHRGFTDYVDLKPGHLFAAPESAVHLS
ncbi:MAG: flippase-like domain-containing protein, partial [Candidatus Hydrogenedentes bacterium]|nr:flippase-like domain-containing protein [Candidatus Hydrogenedentota bacterium]